ncbi:MAG: PilZ domain-containing protein [Acidobacteriota bacterium]|nr:PilZ domain-containing protein [Acidobacteriota bacterium]
MSIISRKKPDSLAGDDALQVLRTSCNKRILARIVTRSFEFEARFLELTEKSLLLDNTLTGLDEVRLLRNRDLSLYFPLRHKLYKGKTRLSGLATIHNIRALRFSIPQELTTDEKRNVKRIHNIPKGSNLTFHTSNFEFCHGSVQNASPNGMAFMLEEMPEKHRLEVGHRIHAEATLGEGLKLSFEAEIRHIEPVGREFRAGVHIIKLRKQAQERYNEWIFRHSRLEEEADDDPSPTTVETVAPGVAAPVAVAPKNNSILVIGPREADQDFWYHCLGRKFEIITCDDNIANIRDSLSSGPLLVLIYLDSKNPGKASFMRKFCGTLGSKPIMFFGEESDPERQKILTGNVNNRGFLDMTERKMLLKFRAVDHVMQELMKTR